MPKKYQRADTRPKNGVNTKGRASTLRQRNNRMKAAQEVGVKSDADKRLQANISRDREVKEMAKRQAKQEAMQMQVEHGMVEEEREASQQRLHKEFIRRLFPPPVRVINFRGQKVFKNKQSMQEFYKRVIEPAEWERNTQLVVEIRESGMNACDI
mmetsp:Transcript_1590/g.2539  ORF Transcript_1590/g.2539 Transcript_1590/m.2539 type:complete len:155 (-) Transcript_1590:120-584(-)